MGRAKARQRTLADIVAEVTSAVAVPPPARMITPGTYNGDGEFFDPDGVMLDELRDGLTPAQVQDAVRQGARVAWDSCGCGAACSGITWPTQTELDRAVRAGPPRFPKRQRVSAALLGTSIQSGTGSGSEAGTGTGTGAAAVATDARRAAGTSAGPRQVVLLTGPVRWGDAIR